MKELVYIIKDENGIHARPAGLLIKEAEKFTSDISLTIDDRTADAKRIFSVMTLGATCGQEVTVRAEGADEDAAIAAMEKFFKENL